MFLVSAACLVAALGVGIRYVLRLQSYTGKTFRDLVGAFVAIIGGLVAVLGGVLALVPR